MKRRQDFYSEILDSFDHFSLWFDSVMFWDFAKSCLTNNHRHAFGQGIEWINQSESVILLIVTTHDRRTFLPARLSWGVWPNKPVGKQKNLDVGLGHRQKQRNYTNRKKTNAIWKDLLLHLLRIHKVAGEARGHLSHPNCLRLTIFTMNIIGGATFSHDCGNSSMKYCRLFRIAVSISGLSHKQS